MRRGWKWTGILVFSIAVLLILFVVTNIEHGERATEPSPSSVDRSPASEAADAMRVGPTEPDSRRPVEHIRPDGTSHDGKTGKSKEQESDYLRSSQADEEEQELWRDKTGQVPRASDDRLLDQALAKLKKGNLAYNTPEKMKTGQTAHVIARIGSDKVPIDTLESGMPTDKETKTATAPTPVSTKMKMALKSADFDITPLSSEEQLVAGYTPTAWAWDIVPKHSGKLRLHLAAVVELNGLSRDFTTVDRDIAVQVDPVDAAEVFVKANGVWMLTTLGAGLAGLWAWLRKKKKPKQPSWETP